MRLFLFFSTILLLVGCTNVSSMTGVVVGENDFQFLILEDVSQKEVVHVLDRPELALKLYDDKGAVWVSGGYNDEVEVGDKVRVWIDGGMDLPWPAYASATSVEVIESSLSE